MKLAIKDIVLIGVVAVVSFPLVFFIMLFITGNARIEIGGKSKGVLNEYRDIMILRQTKRRDSLISVQSNAYLALESERKEIEKERAFLNKNRERTEILKQELESERGELVLERKRLEKIISQNEEMTNKRIKQLAKVYGAMRASEAARILETLDDDLLIKIINAINDERQKAKIMAALSQAKASIISRKMGQL